MSGVSRRLLGELLVVCSRGFDSMEVMANLTVIGSALSCKDATGDYA